MTNTQYIDALTKLYKQVDDLAPYNVEEKRVYILDYIQSQLFGIKTNKKPTRSQLSEIVSFIDKYYRLYDSTNHDTWRYVYSLYSGIYTLINPHMVLNVSATFGIPDSLKASMEKCGTTTNGAKAILANTKEWAENGISTVSVAYEDIIKHLKVNGKSVKATIEKPFPIADKFVNSFYIDSIFRMEKADKLEFVTNKNTPIVIKYDGNIVGVVCPIVTI